MIIQIFYNYIINIMWILVIAICLIRLTRMKKLINTIMYSLLTKQLGIFYI